MPRTFKIEGDMDAASMKAARPMFDELAECNDDVVIDMKTVEFIDSSGVGAIVFLYKRLLESKRKLKLEHLSGQPMQLLSYLRLDGLVAR